MMRRTFFFCQGNFPAFFVSFFVPSISCADAPKDLKIEYDSGSQTLSVAITHKTLFPGMHHIKTVEIKKNSVVYNTSHYDTQPSDVPFIYTYKVEAVRGDTLEVTAICNISGSKTATLTVSAAADARK